MREEEWSSMFILPEINLPFDSSGTPETDIHCTQFFIKVSFFFNVAVFIK